MRPRSPADLFCATPTTTTTCKSRDPPHPSSSLSHLSLVLGMKTHLYVPLRDWSVVIKCVLQSIKYSSIRIIIDDSHTFILQAPPEHVVVVVALIRFRESETDATSTITTHATTTTPNNSSTNISTRIRSSDGFRECLLLLPIIITDDHDGSHGQVDTPHE